MPYIVTNLRSLCTSFVAILSCYYPSFFPEHLDRSVHHRMPWQDIAMCVYGQPARDVARHFVQQHNFYFVCLNVC